MNKYLKLVFLSLLFSITANAQDREPELYIGANAGVTTSNNSQVVVGIESELLMAVDQNFKVGAATGFIFGTEGNGIIMPLALSGRLRADSKFGLGLDLGYGIPLNRASGSLYVRPLLDYKLSYKSKLRFSYSGLNSMGYLNLGIIFNVSPKKTLVISW